MFDNLYIFMYLYTGVRERVCVRIDRRINLLINIVVLYRINQHLLIVRHDPHNYLSSDAAV